jgi:hypothetical protein
MKLKAILCTALLLGGSYAKADTQWWMLAKKETESAFKMICVPAKFWEERQKAAEAERQNAERQSGWWTGWFNKKTNYPWDDPLFMSKLNSPILYYEYLEHRQYDDYYYHIKMVPYDDRVVVSYDNDDGVQYFGTYKKLITYSKSFFRTKEFCENEAEKENDNLKDLR